MALHKGIGMKRNFKALIINQKLTKFMQLTNVFQTGEVIVSVEGFELEISDGEITPAFWDSYAKEFSKTMTTDMTGVLLVWADDKTLNPYLHILGVFKVSDGLKFSPFYQVCDQLGMETTRGPMNSVETVTWKKVGSK